MFLSPKSTAQVTIFVEQLVHEQAMDDDFILRPVGLDYSQDFVTTPQKEPIMG